MAGRKEGTIRESVDQLYQMLDRQQSERQQARIRMLLLLKEDETKTLVQVARMTDRSERMVRRWWKIYQEGGAAALLKDVPGAILDTPRVPEAPAAEQKQARQGKVGPQFLSFLNALPHSGDTFEWIEKFRELFNRLFSDIDRVSINIDIDAQLANWTGTPVTYVTQNVSLEAEMPVHLQTSVSVGSSSPGKEIAAAVRRQKGMLEKYQPPHQFDYHTAEGAYLGSILLWREKGAAPISRETIGTIEDLTPFITFMLTDCIARRQMEDPGVRIFTSTLAAIAEQENLTHRQQEVLTHCLLGRTHMQAAEALNITVHAIRGHVRAIHARTNTHTLLELFARYCTPFQDPKSTRR
jgi:DNA-binding CsgD family transcriptional regulator